MYLSRPGQPFGAGHESAGVTAPALEWFLAEGATGAFFDLFVLIANPGATDAAVSVEYLLVGGGSLDQDVHRAGEFADDDLGGRRAAAGGLGAEAARQRRGLDDRAIDQQRADHRRARDVVARSGPHRELLVRGAQLTRRDDHGDALDHGRRRGRRPGRRRDLRADRQSDDDARAGPGDAAASTRRRGPRRDYDLPAKSRTNVPIGRDFTVGDRRASRSSSSRWAFRPVPIVVERATYASPGGVTWASGGNALASPLP